MNRIDSNNFVFKSSLLDNQPEDLSTRDKIIRAFQVFLLSLNLNEQTNYLNSSSDRSIDLNVTSFCSNRREISTSRTAIDPNPLPDELGPSSSLNKSNGIDFEYIYPLDQERKRRLNIAWDFSYNINLKCPSHIMFKDGTEESDLSQILADQLDERLQFLSQTSKKNLISEINALPETERTQFLKRHNATVGKIINDPIVQKQRSSFGDFIQTAKKVAFTFLSIVLIVIGITLSES
jgi:hypothetical protein